MNESTAIVIFVFNRPGHTRSMLESLKGCHGIDGYQIFVFHDGPRDHSDIEMVEQVQAVLEDYSEVLQFDVITSSSNLGLAASVISGVSSTLLHYKSVIVLEDDLVFNPNELLFLKQAIEIMNKDARIFSASAYSPVDMRSTRSHQASKFDAYLVNRIHSWGWAITSKNWSRIDWTLQDLSLTLKDREVLDFFVEGGSDLIPMLIEQIKGTINSWAIRMALQAASFKEYTIYPSTTLIRNIGFDGSGVHCGINEQIQHQELDYEFTPDLLRYPPVQRVEVIERFKLHYGTR